MHSWHAQALVNKCPILRARVLHSFKHRRVRACRPAAGGPARRCKEDSFIHHSMDVLRCHLDLPRCDSPPLALVLRQQVESCSIVRCPYQSTACNQQPVINSSCCCRPEQLGVFGAAVQEVPGAQQRRLWCDLPHTMAPSCIADATDLAIAASACTAARGTCL